MLIGVLKLGWLMYVLLIFLILLFILCWRQQVKLKNLEIEMENMSSIKEKLYQLGEISSKTRNEQEVYERLLDTAIEIVPHTNKGSILMLGEDGSFHYRVIRGYSDKLKKLTIKKEEAFLCKVNNFKETAIIKEPLKFNKSNWDEEKMGKLSEYEADDITCCISSPIYIDGELAGMINLDSTFANKSYTTSDLKLMNHINNELQLALKNSYIQNKLRRLAHYDELTGIMNRRCFRYEFNKKMYELKKKNKSASLVLMDLDDFKQINDTYGHNIGDETLRCYSQLINESIRIKDVCARMSGDEFVILYYDCNAKEAKIRVEKLRKLVRSTCMPQVGVSFSYGICQIDAEDDLTMDNVFGYVDKKMYENKKLKGVGR